MPNDALSPSALPAASRAVRPDWYWSAPYIAVLIFALAMLVLVWVLQRQEGETQRNALARDVQWASALRWVSPSWRCSTQTSTSIASAKISTAM